VLYAVEHFDAEEFLMKNQNYPHFEEHRKKHDLYRNKMNSFIEELDNENTNLKEFVENISRWLLDWLKMQILEDDVKIPSFLKGE
jgi:hemerythrin